MDNRSVSPDAFYILVRKGRVQNFMMHFEGLSLRAFPMTTTLEDANRLAKHLNLWEVGVRGSMIGAVHGETIQSHLALALQCGCGLLACLDGWNEDNSPRWKVIPTALVALLNLHNSTTH